MSFLSSLPRRAKKADSASLPSLPLCQLTWRRFSFASGRSSGRSTTWFLSSPRFVFPLPPFQSRLTLFSNQFPWSRTELWDVELRDAIFTAAEGSSFSSSRWRTTLTTPLRTDIAGRAQVFSAVNALFRDVLDKLVRSSPSLLTAAETDQHPASRSASSSTRKVSLRSPLCRFVLTTLV